jgi:hypothetical protein
VAGGGGRQHSRAGGAQGCKRSDAYVERQDAAGAPRCRLNRCSGVFTLRSGDAIFWRVRPAGVVPGGSCSPAEVSLIRQNRSGRRMVRGLAVVQHSLESSTDVLQLCEMYRQLNERRLDIDQRIMALPADDPGGDALWHELETNLAELRDVINQLAMAPATDVTQVRAKAVVLATLLRSRDPDGNAVIPDDENAALALALSDDVVRSLG